MKTRRRGWLNRPRFLFAFWHSPRSIVASLSRGAPRTQSRLACVLELHASTLHPQLLSLPVEMVLNGSAGLRLGALLTCCTPCRGRVKQGEPGFRLSSKDLCVALSAALKILTINSFAVTAARRLAVAVRNAAPRILSVRNSAATAVLRLRAQPRSYRDNSQGIVDCARNSGEAGAAGCLAPADGERKTVTALFADIKGSTELMRDLDPEEARAIVDPVLQLMMEAVHRYGGYVAQSTGDGIFALFGAPVAHEDHPQRALHAALAMQEDDPRVRSVSARR